MESDNKTEIGGYFEHGCRGLGKATLAMLFGLLAFAAHGPSVAAGQPDAASFDLDADGVSNAMDSCPRIPNPPVNGQQPQLCGAALDTIIDDYTFLRSRTFVPGPGAVPEKDALPQKPRVHVLLHVRPSEQGIVLPAANRAALSELGVNLLDYVPHNTYFASLPRARIDRVVSMAFVQAVSAIIPEDRIAPDVRLRGPLYGKNADGSVNFEVSFFSDVSLQEQNAILASGAISHRHLYDTTHRVRASGATAVDWFAQRDAVAWIEDVPADNVDDTSNGQSATGADDVIDLLGLTGDGIVVSMIESGQIDPVPHPNMDGRVTLANNPIFAPADGSHASNVGAIMVADGSDGLGNNMGLLPEAELVGYSHAGLTIKRQNFGVPEEARNDYDALLTNFSYSQYNCSKVGDYTKRAKFQDKAAAEAGVVIIKSAGNGRNGNSFIDDTPFTDCTMDLRSLPHASVAKNSIVVGNMNVGSDSVSTLSGSSSSGPTADGRLKPDLVAPGAGLNSIDYDFDNNQAIASSFSGTSASTPFVSGVVGLLGEAFDDNGIDPNTVPPARYKAILVHTARDEGPTGPDFRHGYGLVQPEQAVRIADEWGLWGREDSVDENTTSLAFSFDITSPHSFFKVTLAWDDEKGEHTSTLALKNDLDLTLISPSGVVHRPYDLDPPAAGSDIDPGATPCTVATCVDRLNNVEMVLAEAPVGFSEVEQGTWSAEVTVHRLVSNDQPFSLVLTPDCPILIDQDTVLSGDILCSSTSVDAVGIRISGAGVELDCNGHKVESASLVDGSRGIVSTADGVTIRRCLVQRFDTGIEAIEPNGAANDNQIVDNRVRSSGDYGISVEGKSHRVFDNTVYQMEKETGIGVRVDGSEIDVESNDFPLAYGLASGADTIAVYVASGSQLGSVDDNQFSGLWKYGIYLYGGTALTGSSVSIQSYSVSGNTFEGIDDTPIYLLGGISDTTVADNQIQAYGLNVAGNAAPAISLSFALFLDTPSNNTISGNTVIGQDAAAQVGIYAIGTEQTSITGNPSITGVGRGIVDISNQDSYIFGNTITNTTLAFVSDVGIESEASSSGVGGHIVDNDISRASVGISVVKPTASVISLNQLNVGVSGILVEDATGGLDVSSNAIRANALGVSVARSASAVVHGNSFQAAVPGLGTAVSVTESDDATVSGNTAAQPMVGISVAFSANASVSGNEVSDAAATGLGLLDTDDAEVIDNIVLGNGSIGILFADGVTADISNNTVNSVGLGQPIQLGDDPAAACAVDVDDIDLVGNTLIGGALPAIAALCDVGVYTVTP